MDLPVPAWESTVLLLLAFFSDIRTPCLGKHRSRSKKRLLDRHDPFLWQRPTPMLLPADDLADECGEVTGSAPVAIEYEGALAAAKCPFGQAQFGCHHATPPNRSWNWDTTCSRCTAAHPTSGFCTRPDAETPPSLHPRRGFDHKHSQTPEQLRTPLAGFTLPVRGNHSP
jgi:hypothetical protein